MIRSVSSLLFGVAIALASYVALVPSAGADHPGIAALLCLGAGAIALRFVAVKHRVPWSFYLMLLPALALLMPMVVIARAFRRLDMVSLIFHADMGMADAGIEGLETEVLQGALVCGFILIGCRGLVRLWGLGWRSIAAMAGFVLLINPLVLAIGLLLTTPAPKDDLSQRLSYPEAPAPQIADMDLLMIYIEGTDRQFADAANWPGAYDPLHAIASNGVAFTNVQQITGTGWSLAGVVATQCGVPILPRGLLYGTNFERLHQFMPGLTCLGDMLAEHGYDSRYIVGGPLEFGGLDILFRGHGYTEAIGRQELEARLPASEINAALIGWILDDQLLFDESTRLHKAMVSGEKPYALVIETIGPHGNKGLLSRHCAPDGRAGFSADFDRVLRCTIDDTAAFVAAARERHAQQRPDRPLLVVLLSDHLSHNALIPRPSADYAGFNTVIFSGAPDLAPAENTKPGSMIDVLPTVLQVMGLAKPPYRAGLGVSLLTEEPSLVGAYGVEALEPMLLFNRALADRIWKPAPSGPWRGRPGGHGPDGHGRGGHGPGGHPPPPFPFLWD